MAKKKAAVKKVGGKKRLGKKSRGSRPNLLPQDSSAYVRLGDAAVSGGGGIFDPLVVRVVATAEDCSNSQILLNNFSFRATIGSIESGGQVENPDQDSSEVVFYFPSWADGIQDLADELVVSVSAKKRVKVVRA